MKKKKFLSLLLVLVMCLTLIPAVSTAYALQDQTTEQASEDKAVVALQTMIDDLPEQVTEDNLEEVTAQLETIEGAMDDMTDEQLDGINPTRYETVVSALAQLGGGDASALMTAANGVTKYDLWIGTTQVTSENKDSITGEGITGSVSYDPNTKTLTLNNAKIKASGAYGGYISAIYCPYVSYGYPLNTINLIGENTVQCSSSAQGKIVTIRIGDDLTIAGNGTGSLNVYANDFSTTTDWITSVAIDVSGALTIDNASVFARGGDGGKTDSTTYAIDCTYINRLILKNAKVTKGVLRNMTNPPTLSGGFKYSEINCYKRLTIVPTDGHEHYLCGGAYKCIDTHEEESSLTTFTAWNAADALPDTEGNYYLTTDVTLSDKWEPTVDVNLCLNGHEIKGASFYDVISVSNERNVTVTDCGGDSTDGTEAKICHKNNESGSGVNVAENGTFTLYGGNITANTCGVNNKGTFNMYGGSITKNISNAGPGAVINDGTMNMYGGSITENSSPANACGSVLINERSSITLGGSAKIMGNTLSNDTVSNLYMDDGVQMTVDASDKLYFKGEVGISASNQDTLTGYDNIITISENALSSNTSPYVRFKADNAAYETCTDSDGKLALRKARTAVSLDCSYRRYYDGTEQTGVREKAGYTLSGDIKGTFPKTYTATATLADGYKWNDNSTDPKEVTWEIAKRNVYYSDFTFTPTSATYDGEAQTPTVTLNSTLAANGGYGDLTVAKYYSKKTYKYVTADQVKDVGQYSVYVSLTEGAYFNSKESLYIGVFEITKADGPEAPECTFSFDGDNAGKLMGADDTMEYSLDGENWNDCTADMLLDTEDITSANGIQIRVKGTDNVDAGEVQTITITEQAAPTAGKTDCTGKYEKGSLTGVSAAMEYKQGNNGDWTSVTGTTVEGLEAGTYYVRYKATGTKLASPAQELTIAAYELKTDTYIIDFTINNVEGQIDSENDTITVNLPYTADTDITKLKPSITVSPQAGVIPAGLMETDFTNPVQYTVTAENGNTRTYTVTVTMSKLKLTSVTAPKDTTLESFYETADAVIATLPTTVTVATENPTITTLPCTWTCSGTYNRTPGAENTFHWTADTNGCDVNGQTVAGDVTLTNRAAIQLTADAATLTTEKEYDGSNGVNGVYINNIAGIETPDTNTVYVTAVASYDSKAVGARTITVKYSLTGDGAWKYLAPIDEKRQGKITQRPVTITGLKATNRAYVKDDCTVELTGGSIDNVISGEKVTIDLRDAKGTMADCKVGTGKAVTVTGVKLSGDNAGNYDLSAQPTDVTVDINKLAAPVNVAASYEVIYNDSTEKAIKLTDFNLPEGIEGAKLSAASVPQDTSRILGLYAKDCFALNSDLNQDKAGSTATLTITITSDNYEDITATVTVKAISKHPVTVEITGEGNATYGDVITLTALQEGDSGTGGKWSWSYDSNNFTLVEKNETTGVIKLKAAKVAEGGVEVTASYDSSSYTGTAKKTITISKKAVTVEGITADSKVYDGTTNAKINTTDATIKGKLDGDSLTVTASGAFADKNAGQTKAVNLSNLTLAGTDATNYTIDLDGSQKTAQAAINRKVIGIGRVTLEPKKYDGSNKAVVTDITFENLCGFESLTKDEDYTVRAEFNDAAKGTNKPVTVFVTMKATTAANNYQLGDNPDAYVYSYGTSADIAAGDGGNLGTENISRKYTDHSEYSYTPSFEGLPTGQTWKYTVATSCTGSAALTTNSIDENTGALTYAVSAGDAGDTITWTISIDCDNYGTFTRTVVLTLAAKGNQDTLTVSSSASEVTYGNVLTLSATGGSGTGDVTYEVTGGDGEAAISGNVLKATKAGTVKVKAIKAGDKDYNEAESAEITITVNKAKPVGTPGYTRIKSSGRTLAEALLTVGDITPAGTIAWDDGDTQIAEKNAEYGWTFTPEDTVNYDVLTGVLKPYVSSSSGSKRVYYNVTVSETEDGKAEASDRSVSRGDTVTVTAKPDSGFVIEKVEVKAADGNAVKLTEGESGKYTFTMPGSDVEIKVSFTKEAQEEQEETHDVSFADVSEEDYFYEAVKWAAEKKITTGVDGSHFAPNDECTRAQIVTFLWRASGSPEVTADKAFSDVASDGYYAKAVAWAVANGITKGTDDAHFSPDDICTRAQSVTFLARALKGKAEATADFTDVSADGYYASAVAWAKANGITTGVTESQFGPDEDCTRAQIVTFLYRAYNGK